MRGPAAARALGSCLALALLAPAGQLAASPSPSAEHGKRVEAIRRIPGLVAFWDFVLRETAVFGRALSAREMRRLASIGRVGGQPRRAFRLLHAADLRP